MRDINGNLLPFNRDGAFFHKRAARHRDAGRWMEALTSLREAIKREPNNPQFAMDWAMFCFEQGYIEESVRILMGMLSGEPPIAEAFFGLACCFFSVCEYQRAYAALDTYMSMSGGEGEYADEANEMIQELRTIHEDTGIGMVFSGLPWESLLVERIEPKLKKSIESSWNVFSVAVRSGLKEAHDSPEMQRAASALDIIGALMAAHRRDMLSAERLLSSFTARECNDVYMLLAAAFTRHLQGRTDSAYAIYDYAMEHSETFREETLLLLVGGIIGRHLMAYDIACGGLMQWPLNRQLLHASSVAAHYLGYDAKTVALGWETMLRACPEDTVAQYYLTALKAGTLNAPIYAIDVPKSEAKRYSAFISRTATRYSADMPAYFVNSEKLRNLCAWAMCSTYEDARRAAERVMRMGDKASVSDIIKTCLCDMHAPDDAKMQWVHMLAELAVPDPYPVLMEGGVVIMGVKTINTAELPKSYHRVLTVALERMREVYDVDATDVERLWLSFWRAYDKPSGLRRLNSWSAALECVWVFKRDGHMPEMGDVARRYDEDEKRIIDRVTTIMRRMEL